MRSQDCFSFRRNLKELLHLKNDASGYIEGKVFMIWPPRQKFHRINIEVAEDSELYRFELEVPHNDGISFRPHERICFALQGMKVVPRKQSSAPYYFPIVLRYPDGVVLKYLTGVNAGKVIDTWLERAGNADEWYNPGVVHTVSDAVTIDVSDIYHGRAPTVIHPPMSSPSSEGINHHTEGIRVPAPLIVATDDSAIAESMQLGQQPSTEKLGRSSKMKPRKKRKLRKGQGPTFPNQISIDAKNPPQTNVALLHHEQLPTLINSCSTTVCDNPSRFDRPNGHEGRDIDILHESNRTGAIVMSRGVSAPALHLKAGIYTQRGDTFTAIGDLQKGHSLVNVIGVVISVSPERKTRTDEWIRSFSLVDPSTVDSSRRSITVNCFQKKHLEWLPQVQKDDIIILRKLKIGEWNGDVAVTGYGDKLRWAVYDPLKDAIRPPNRGSAPEKEPIDDGLGYEFSPYWEPFQDSAELDYCRQIREWWRAKRELGGPEAPTLVYSMSPPKQHLLISEASPDLPPKGFFNCTVEVLRKFKNQEGPTTVYVTDYTASPLIQTIQATWCPPDLSDFVLQCDMWDQAKEIAEVMSPGEYWYLHNIRARWNPSRHMEGTMQLAEKVAQLDESHLEARPHLKALLVRKKEFELNKPCSTSGVTSSHIFPYMLFQDVEETTSFITCIVELLHVDLDTQDGHFIYVTDYTYNPNLPDAVSSAKWAHNLQHRLLKIKLDDSQAKLSLHLSLGSLYVINNLRIKRSSVSGMALGCLGGEDILISLHDSSSHHAQTLQRNKEKWEREIILSVSTVSNRGPNEIPKQPSTVSDTITLQDILTRPAPDVFRVIARVVDFFPFSLEDASVLRCTKCKSSPPALCKACPRCDDMMETYCKWCYCLYILLQDEDGIELTVSLSGKECMLLQDVNPTDLRRDLLAFRKFLEKLDPVLGNLREVHLAWSRNEQKDIESPLMIFTIESWSVGNEKGYGLLNYFPT